MSRKMAPAPTLRPRSRSDWEKVNAALGGPFVGWLEERGVQHIDLWRADLNTLNHVDGTLPWIYDTLASFLKGS